MTEGAARKENRVDEIAERVERLEDMAAIHQLFIDYGMHLDAKETPST